MSLWKNYSITVEETQGMYLVQLKGKITRGEASDKLRQSVEQLLNSNKKVVVLNMRKVKKIDNHGIAALVAAYGTSQQRRSRLKLMDPSKEVLQALDKVFLTAFVDVCRNETEALAG